MSYTTLNYKTDLQAMLHGTSLSKVSSVSELINRAARDVLLDVDPQETKRKALLSTPIFDSIYDYAAPSDLKGNKVIDIRPQVNRAVRQNLSATFSENFDLYKETSQNMFHVEHDQGTKFLRIDIPMTSKKVLNQMESATANGTWAVGNDATNITTDSLYYVEGSASLNFDLDGSTTDGYIENSTMAQVDLSDEDENSSLFAWVYIPDSTIITNFILRWGNDTSNYWSRTVTAPHYGSFTNGWNLLRFDWNGATETGTVAPATVDYLRFTVTYDGTADTDFRLDEISVSRGKLYEILYYSDALFKDGTSGAAQQETDSDSDIIILGTDGINLLLYRGAYLAAQQIQGADASFDATVFGSEYERLKKRYKSLYKSEVEKPRQQYYRIPQPNAQSKRELR